MTQRGNSTATPPSSPATGSIDGTSIEGIPVGGITPTRRQFVQTLGAGLLIAVSEGVLPAKSPGQAAGGGRGGRGGRGGGGEGRGGGFGRGGSPTTVAARLHVGRDGVITLLTGKVECGQGARAELTQAAAEELRVPPERIVLVMADTGLVPDDGMTAGSRTTPSTVPAVRRGAAAARELLAGLAAGRWGVPAGEVEARYGKISHAASHREIAYGELAAADDEAARAYAREAGKNVPDGISVAPVKEWKVLGTSLPRPNRRDLVTGGHHYPSDVSRPGMLYGKVLRQPAYGATLASIDLGPAKDMPGVTAFRDGPFVGVAAATSFHAAQALAAIEPTARWDGVPTAAAASDAEAVAEPGGPDRLFDDLRRRARGGLPANPFAAELAKAAKAVRATYHVAYIQHAPLEPRAAVAEWTKGEGDGARPEKAGDDKQAKGEALTVWTGTQNPFGVRSELARAFGLAESAVRVIVPDFGGGFGGKHSGEAAVEAARLARAAGRPVHLRWTRHEELTWAYFRPAGVIDAEAGLDADGAITSWHFINVNSGQQSVEPPYRVGKSNARFVSSEPPLRHGSYRGLAATANTFARECFMDELAAAAGKDPLAFRLAHLQEPRLCAVLEEAADRFNWAERSKKADPDTGIGLACGTEKGSFVAACAEVAVDRKRGRVTVRRVCQAFECGAVLNPGNLTSQIQGAIMMGLGPVLREQIKVGAGKVLNASFAEYLVPRFEDAPEIEVHLADRPDLPSGGAGETPIIAVAPAVANAVSRAIGQRVRDMPMRLPKPA